MFNRLTSISCNNIINLPKYMYFTCGHSSHVISLTETIPYISHARSRNFAWYLLWLSTTEGKIIFKLLVVNQTREFQLFLTDFHLPSNFWKVARPLGNTKYTVGLRFKSLSFTNKKIVLWEDMRLLAMNSLYNEKRQWPRLVCSLACLRSFILRANCNFESKQAISSTLFGRHPNNNYNTYWVNDLKCDFSLR